jgi:hypothetical protein
MNQRGAVDRPGVSDFQGHVVDHVVALEDAVSLIMETADDRHVQLALARRGCPPDAPEARVGVEQPQRIPLELAAAGHVRHAERVSGSHAVEDRLRDDLAVEGDPLRVAWVERFDALAV